MRVEHRCVLYPTQRYSPRGANRVQKHWNCDVPFGTKSSSFSKGAMESSRRRELLNVLLGCSTRPISCEGGPTGVGVDSGIIQADADSCQIDRRKLRRVAPVADITFQRLAAHRWWSASPSLCWWVRFFRRRGGRHASRIKPFGHRNACVYYFLIVL